MSKCSEVRAAKDWVEINIQVNRGRPFYGKETLNFYGTAEQALAWLEEKKSQILGKAASDG